MRRLSLQVFIWAAITLLLVIAARFLPFREIWETLRQISLPAILILILVNSGIMVLFSARWWLILRAMGYRLPYLSLTSLRLAGFGISYFTPGTQFGGEPLQAYGLVSRHNLPASTAMSSVALDKLLELVSNFTFLALGVGVMLQNRLGFGLDPEKAFVISLAFLALPVGYLGALWLGARPVSALLAFIGKRLTRVQVSARLQQVIALSEEQAARFCREKPVTLTIALLVSMLVWVVMIAEFWLMLTVLGIDASLPQAISALAAARLAFLTPIPGGLGALEASQVFILQALGYPPAAGFSLSFLIRGRDFLVGGVSLLWAGKVTQKAPAFSLIDKNRKTGEANAFQPESGD
jgi:hypothetical protein